MEQVVIGADRHNPSATIGVVDDHDRLLGQGRFATDRAGYSAMRTYAKAWPVRAWVVEGGNGVGRPLAQGLPEDGEQVVEVPAKPAARARLFDTGHNRKTDARDAHSIENGMNLAYCLPFKGVVYSSHHTDALPTGSTRTSVSALYTPQPVE